MITMFHSFSHINGFIYVHIKNRTSGKGSALQQCSSEDKDYHQMNKEREVNIYIKEIYIVS